MSRRTTVAVTAAALVGIYLVPAVPAAASSSDGVSEADRAAAAAAAAPPAAASSEGGRGDGNGDGDGNWFTDLFDGEDASDEDPVPADRALATQAHAVAPEPAAAKEPGERVRELKDKRTASSRTFQLDDGQRQVELSGEPLFYESARDGLVEIDTTVAATGKAVAAAGAKGLSAKAGKTASSRGWSHASFANTARSYFGQRADRVVRVEDESGSGVTVGLPDAEDGELSSPRVDGDTVTHEDVAALDGADLSYEVLPGRVKESITLAEAPAEDADAVEYTFTLSDLGDLTPRVEDDGSIGFYGELDPEPAVAIPAGVMWDSREVETSEGGKLSAPDDQGAAVSTDVVYELEPSDDRSGDGAWTLTVTPDLEWLTDEARVWPVTVDPTIIISPTGDFSKDTMLLSEAPDTEYYTSSRLSVGRTEGGVARALLAYPQLADVVPTGSTVTDADLGLYFDQAHTDWATRVPLEVREVTGAWNSPTANWTNANGLEGGIAGIQRTFDNTHASAQFTGSWPASANTALTRYAYGNTYQYSYGNGNGTTDQFSVTPSLPEAGVWQIRTSHVPAEDRATASKLQVTFPGGSTRTYNVDMTRGTPTSGGVWSVVASHTLDAGAKVAVTDAGVPTSQVVIADAVRLIKGGTVIRTPGQIAKWHNYDVTQTVKKWATGSLANNGFMVRATDESVNGPLGGPRYEAAEDEAYGGETRNMPRLVVTYGQPGVVTDIPDTIHATGAELSWSTYKDPSSGTGDNLVEYQVHRSVSQTFKPSATTLVSPVAPGTTAFVDTTAVQTPADQAGLGKLYYYQVAVKRRDGTIVPSSTQIVRLPKAGRTTKVLVASGDTSLASGKPTQNLNTVEEITTQHWDLVGNASPFFGDTRTVMEWDDAAWDIPDSAVVMDASLRMWQETTETTRTNPDDSMVYPTLGRYQLRRQLTEFDQATATWNSPGAGGTWPAGGNIGTSVYDTVTGVGEGPSRLSWNAASVVQAWVNDPALYRGLVVRMDDEVASQDRSLFASTEAEDNAGLERSGPRLSVTYLSTAPEDTFYAPDTPERMRPGTAYDVPVTVSNTTQTTWVAGSQELVASWTLPDGSVAPGSEPTTAALPEDLSSGEVADITASVVAPPVSDGNLRSDYSLSWGIANSASPAQEKAARADAQAAGESSADVAASAQGLDTTATGDVAEQTEASSLAEAGIAALPAGKLKQNVAVEDPTSDQLGLESFYTYAGKNTGAGSTVMNNVAAGNAVWSYDAFSNPGRGLSTFARFSYNSQDTSDTVSGFGWSAQVAGPIRLGAPLEFHPNNSPREVMLPDGDGTTHVFRLNSTTGQWDAPAGVNYRLTQKAGVDCRASNKDPDPDAWTMLRPDGTQFVFGCDGYLNQVIDKNGNVQQFTYAERQSNNQPRKFLQYVTDPTGRQTLTVDYWTKGQTGWQYVDETTGNLVNGSGGLNNSKIYDHVRSMTDVSGRKLEFYYTDKGLMGRMVDGAGATDDAGKSIAKTFKFTYDADQGNKNVKLTRVTDPRGGETDLSYFYPSEGDDPKDHWSTQTITDRNDGVTTFDYAPHPTTDDWWNSTVTDAEGHATKYVSDDFGRPRSVTNAKDETVALTWDGDNNVRTLTEANGAVTAYCYDPKTGYPLWQRDAEQNAAGGGAPAASECVPGEAADQAPAGAQVMEYQTWESGHVAQIARTTSPEGRKNQFSYDDDGNLLTVTDGKGLATATAGDYTTSYTYDTYGQLLTTTDANENTTEYSGYGTTQIGYPTTITDALGHDMVTQFSDDGRGLVVEVVEPGDGLITRTYDAFGRPLVGTSKKSATETITTPAPVYDANDNVTVSTAPNGAVSTATYDATDQVTAASAPNDTTAGPSRIAQYEYDTVGNVLKTTEPKGVATTSDATDFVTSYAYDTIYQLAAVKNAEGDWIEYDYDEVGNTVEVRDPIKVASADTEDYSSKIEYDLNHRPAVALDAAGNRTTTDYDADGLTVSSTDALGNTSYVAYDERGAAVESKVPHSGSGASTVYRTTKTEYDEVGNQTRVITPRGVATANAEDFAPRTEFDELNRPVRSYQPYDPADSRYNDANVYTETTYDAAGRVVATSLPPSENQSVRNTTKVEYFANGWVKQSVDPHAITTSYDYNEVGQQTARTLTAADGSTSRTMAWSYFPDGKQASMSDDGAPVGSNVTLVDNTDSQSTSATGTWATASTEGEQGFNHRTHTAGTGTDAFTWDLDVPAGGTYDLYVTYPQVPGAASGAKYQLTHDPDSAEGAEPEVVEPAVTVNQTTGAGAWRKVGSYTLSANELASVDLVPSSTGVVVADAVKLVRDNSADTDTEQKTFTYGYDVNGNLTGITDESAGASVSSYEVAYDELNQVRNVTENATSGATVTAYGYNSNGQPLTVDHPDQAAEYGYDLRNLVETVNVTDTAGVSAGDPETTSYTYDERGAQVTQTKGNGNVATNAYFNDGALRSTLEETSSGSLVASHDYTYNENGSAVSDVASKRSADTEALMNSTTSYTYAPADRLVEKVKTGNGASSEMYVHDDNANVVNQIVGGITTTYSYDRNRLQSTSTSGQTGSASYTYDPFGRQASVTAAGLVISRNTYDGFDHVVKSEQMGDIGTLEATTYAFDPLDRTTSKTSGGETTRFTYLGISSEVLTEDVAGQLAKSYQYSPWGQRLSQVTHPGAPDESDGDGAPKVGTAFYGYNAHTDVETVTDEAGGTVATYGYTAFGSADDAETTGIDTPNPAAPDAEPFNAYRYNAKRFDAASGAYDMGFRNYDPGLNRFTSRDMYNGALADLGLGSDPYTSNRYAFGAGNPISFGESDGHLPCKTGIADACTASGVGFSTAAAAPSVAQPTLLRSVLTTLKKAGRSGLTGFGTQANEIPQHEYWMCGTKSEGAAKKYGYSCGDESKRQGNACGTGWIKYQPLDLANGSRAQGVLACLTKSQLDKGSETNLAKFTPPGYAWAKKTSWWLGVPSRDGINACHLLANRLGGSGTNPKNLATCSRSANAASGLGSQGINNMAYYEDLVAKAVSADQNVLYSVTAQYDGPRTVPVSFDITAYGTHASGTPGLVIDAAVPNVLSGQNLGGFRGPGLGFAVPTS